MSELVSHEGFDIEKTYEYILSIQVSLDGFSFSILSQHEDKILASKINLFKISSTALIARRFNDWLEFEELLKKPFRKVRVTIFSEKFTLIPEEYFQDRLKQDIPPLLFGENDEPEIAENIVRELATRVIFTLPPGLNKVIAEQIGECEIVHPVKIILSNLPKTEKENGLILLFDAKNFYVVLFKNNKVLLANCFKISHVNDVVYYVLTTLKQLEIPVSKTDLFIIKSVNKLSGIDESLKSYFTEIKELKLIQFLLDVI